MDERIYRRILDKLSQAKQSPTERREDLDRKEQEISYLKL